MLLSYHFLILKLVKSQLHMLFAHLTVHSPKKTFRNLLQNRLHHSKEFEE
uniref:Uncharacterized protein n=1 Tax=Rhizophora mucronata TaxID=61149 RepID=A0A2P2NAM1_RHIMU